MALDALKRERANALARVEEIDGAIRALEKIYEGSSEATITLPDDNLSPAQAIRWIFEHNRKRQFYPSDLRNLLKELRSLGRLQTVAHDLLGLTHLTLRRLVAEGVIEAEPGSEIGQRKWYRIT
jgi:hypothetical protein